MPPATNVNGCTAGVIGRGASALALALGIAFASTAQAFSPQPVLHLDASAAALGAAALVCKNENSTALLDRLGPLLVERLGVLNGHLDPIAAPSRPDPVDLSPRQQQMWQAIAEGMSNGEIAERYGISLNTTKAHVRELLQRLGVRNRTEAATMYYRARQGRAD